MARCAYGRAHSDRNGDTSAPLGVGPPSAFCDYDASVDATLGDLHRLLQAGARGVQWQIDQYIVSSSSKTRSHLRLHRSMVPHYDNLPDISFLVCNGITHAHTDAEVARDFDRQASLLIRQCSPLRRRTRRAQREVMWKPDNLHTMRVILRCTQGLQQFTQKLHNTPSLQLILGSSAPRICAIAPLSCPPPKTTPRRR